MTEIEELRQEIRKLREEISELRASKQAVEYHFHYPSVLPQIVPPPQYVPQPYYQPYYGPNVCLAGGGGSSLTAVNGGVNSH